MADSVTRRYTFKLYPNREQERVLTRHATMCAELWNAALQRREDVYRREGKTLSAYDLCKEIKYLRRECPEWRELNADTPAQVIFKLDEAFKAFFKRAKSGAGAASGYPRYKRTKDGDSIPFRENGKGWRLYSASEFSEKSEKGRFTACRNGKSHHDHKRISPHQVKQPSNCGVSESDMERVLTPLVVKQPSNCGVSERQTAQSGWKIYVKGIPGLIKARGKFPVAPDDIRDCVIMRRDGAWWISVVVKIAPRMTAGRDKIEIKFDLIDEFARVERAKGECLARSKEQISTQAQQHKTTSGVVAGDLGGDDRPCGSVPRHGQGVVAGDLGGDDRASRSMQSVSAGVVAGDLGGDDKKMQPLTLRGVGVVTAESADHMQSECDRRYRKFSWRWRRERRRVARLRAIEARRRKHALHTWSTTVVRAASDITVTASDIKSLTATPRGDARQWGASVKTVSSLNRHILGQAPSLAVQMLRYKAEEAGIRCDIIEDDAPNIAIGGKLVAAGKAVRKAKRALKKA